MSGLDACDDDYYWKWDSLKEPAGYQGEAEGPWYSDRLHFEACGGKEGSMSPRKLLIVMEQDCGAELIDPVVTSTTF